MNKDNNNMSTLGYFHYFKTLVGYHIYVYILLNFIVGLLDSFGLVLFIPILSIASGKESATSDNTFGQGILIKFIESLGLELNLTVALISMVIIFAFKGLFYYIRSIYFLKLKLKSARTIRLQLVNSFENVSYEKFTTLDSGIVQNSMIGEISRMIASMTHFFSAFQSIIMLITYVSIAFLANWKFAILVAFGGLITNFLYKFLNNITKNYSKRLTFVGANFNGLLLESINYYKYLKATNYFEKWKKRLYANIFQGEEYNFTIGKISAISDSSREPLIIAIIAAVILIQVNFLGGDFSSILVSLLLFYRALTYLSTLQNKWNLFLGVSAGVYSIEEILTEFKKNNEKKNNGIINKVSHISLKNVNVSYGSKRVLKNISMDIKDKTSIAFIGESGAGKTTLANLICGLIPSQSGDVIVDNQSIQNTNILSLRNKIGYITQEPVIFNGTIFENVTFWEKKEKQSLEKFWNVMEMVSLKDFVNSLNHKEDALTGNGGVLISGGQKQRISIARELYKNVELLIMDEATSALDSETEQFIKNNIDMLHGKFTMVIIAHRLSTIRNVDVIYLLENGEIIDFGNFSELISKSDKFRNMVKIQGLQDEA